MIAGYVYAVIAYGEVPRVKVGRSINPRQRLAEMQTGSPAPMRLHSTTWHEDVRKAEADAHTLLGGTGNGRGREWFDYKDPRVRAWLAQRLQDLAVFNQEEVDA